MSTRCRGSQRVVVVVGATGAVGRELLEILRSRGVPDGAVRALASERSNGSLLPYGEIAIPVTSVCEEAFAGATLAIFAADAAVSRCWVPVARRAGALVIDNSSAFRLDADVPLVVPEVNGGCLEPLSGPSASGGLVANPNCSAAILTIAVAPLLREFGLEAITVSTYQAVSGAGLAAMEELKAQAARAVAGELQAPGVVFGEPCAFNVFSHDSAVELDSGINGEERKIISETRKLLATPRLPVTPTCVRVPVIRAHTQAITARLERAVTESEVRAALSGGAGLRMVDDRARNSFPTPLKASGCDDVLVGRVRLDPGLIEDVGPGVAPRSRGVCLLVCGDQLRKGAALNAVQIAEHLGVLEYLIRVEDRRKDRVA